MKKLNRVKQCSKCPWKVTTDPNEIPNGYSREKHESLRETITEEANVEDLFNKELRVMACHCSRPGSPEHCVGWLHNQLGPGNNLALRLSMYQYSNAGEIEVFGEQHETFDQTLPAED